MTFDWAIYGPPLYALIGGLGAGALLAWRMPASQEEEALVLRDGRVEDLAGTREDAVAALRALEQERAKLPEAEYVKQRRELLERGASALRELDEGVDIPVEDPLADRIAALEAQRATLGDAAVDAGIAALRGSLPRPATGSSAWTGVGWTVGLLAVAGLLWMQLSGDAVPRGGGSMTGNAGGPMEAPPPQPAMPEHPMKAEWTAALAADPTDLVALNGLTEVAIAERDLGTALDLSGKALEVAPKDLDARTHRAVLQAAVGMSPRAFEMLEEVRTDAPDFAKAWVYTGLLALDQGRYDLAVEALTRSIELEPDRADFLVTRLEAAKVLAEASKNVLVTGHVEAPGITPTGSETLYVSVRDPAGGPPVAALRLPPQLPADIAVTGADLITMGGPPRDVPDQLVVSVRLDGDGNPMTPDGPASEAVTVAKGTTGLQFVLVADGSAQVTAPTPAPAAGGEVLIAGRVEAPGIAPTGTETLYVSVRDPAGGPPLAAVRLPPTLPADIVVTRDDLIAMGGAPRPVPAQVVVTVRLDGDGNPMTKDGPAAAPQTVAPGASGLSFVLQAQ